MKALGRLKTWAKRAWSRRRLGLELVAQTSPLRGLRLLCLRREKLKTVGHEHVIFNDAKQGVAVNVVPFSKALYIPRAGERIYLPGMKDGGSGFREVESVTYSYHEDEDPDGNRCREAGSRQCASEKGPVTSQGIGSSCLTPIAGGASMTAVWHVSDQ